MVLIEIRNGGELRKCLKRLNVMKTALCALVVAGSLAGAAKADFQMIGAGIVSCGTWTADRQYPGSADALQDEQWVVVFYLE